MTNAQGKEKDLTVVFKALSHPARREILDLLKRGPMTTNEVSERFEVSRYQVMKHLDLLEEANLVLVRRKGRMRYNYLNSVPLRQMYDRWISQYESVVAGSLLKLKEQLERGNSEMNQEQLKKDSFEIEMEVTINAPRSRVFDALTKDIGNWWAFRVGAKDSKVILEPHLGGRFYEDWGNGQGAIWGTIYYLQAPQEIRLSGPLGMQGAINSHYTYVLEEVDISTTILKLSHHTTGLLHPNWEESHRQGWELLLGKFLKDYVEKGTVSQPEMPSME